MQAKVLTTARDGFSLNAAVACKAHQRHIESTDND